MGRQAIAAARAVALVALTSLAAACGEPTPPGGEPIDREVFIETYVELRLAALAAEDFVVPPEEREEILARHGVDQEGLLRFAEVHGQDVDFMNEVWAEVERLIEERRPTEDTAA
jgi:hypothetical protein